MLAAIISPEKTTALVCEYRKEADRVLLSRGKKSGFTIKRGQLNTDESVFDMLMSLGSVKG